MARLTNQTRIKEEKESKQESIEIRIKVKSKGGKCHFGTFWKGKDV